MEKIDKFDIESNHIEEQILIQNINYIELNKTSFFTIIEDIQINFMMEMNDIFLSETSWSIPLSSSDFIFEWNIDETKVIDDVPINLEMSVLASSDSERIVGEDFYEFSLSEDNLYYQSISDVGIYKYFGFALLGLVIFGLIAIGISTIFKVKK